MKKTLIITGCAGFIGFHLISRLLKKYNIIGIDKISKYYSKYYKIPSIGIRFLTCYGPWGRPNLSVSQITDSIIKKKQVVLLNNGKIERDYTYIDDTIDGIIKCSNFKKKINKDYHDIYNLGTGKTHSILKLSKIIGKILNIDFKIILKQHHPTDMIIAKSNMIKSIKDLKYNPKIKLGNGLKKYLDWHLKYNF